MKQADKIIQEALVKNNVLTEIDIRRHLKDAQTINTPLEEYLIAKEIVTKKQVLIALSQTLKIKTLDLNSVVIHPDVIEKVPIKFAWHYKIMPVAIYNNVLKIASEMPLDIKIQDEIRVHLGFEIDLVLVEYGSVLDALKKYYGFASDTIDRIMAKELVKEKVSSSDTGQWIEDLEKQTEDPTVANLVNQIILEAYKKRATDIHIEPYRDRVRFRYRIDGVLVDANLPPEAKHFLSPILSRIKILANLSITEKRIPQDGSAVVKTKEQTLDLRISTMPTPRGESMVIRILPSKVMLFSLEKLGFNYTSVNQFRELISKPHGIIFITGPTGSGKTTTLYACLNEINSSERKIITIEDPVEYEMDGVTQVQVNPKVNFDFSTGLRSILRHDPDIIMVGEVRDVETAEIAIRTALTGHLVFSTLHTNDAASGITRLIDMGIEPYLVASSVEAFVAQRLIRIICPKCKEEDNNVIVGIKEEISHSLELESIDDVKIFKGKGCDYCNQTGFYGRMAIYEILMLNDVIRAAMLEKPRPDYIKKIAIKEGLTTLRQNGWKAVIDGLTTPGEVMNVTTKDESLTQGTVISKHTRVGQETDNLQEVLPTSNEYKGRIYSRCMVPVKIRYRLVTRDPNDPNSLISDGIEYPTFTQDISAGGLKFESKMMMTVGTLLELKIQLEEGQKSVSCLGKVYRLEEDSLKNIFSIVTCFLDISGADRAFINKFVEKKLKEKTRLQLQRRSA
ncbi:MAG: Flp pilus assembly complex ATPase component TadA [Candidatus Omnitrophica bacterium]|nr:Flp pilus assembly complex ATPase component TadA [Candidatus Omnitrophota bacterium]